MLQFLRIPIWEHPCLEADQMIVAYKSLASLSGWTDLIQHVTRLGFCTYILGYLWTALFKSGSNLQRVWHVARSSVTFAGQCYTYLYLSPNSNSYLHLCLEAGQLVWSNTWPPGTDFRSNVTSAVQSLCLSSVFQSICFSVYFPTNIHKLICGRIGF